jgi:hypothetical protein
MSNTVKKLKIQHCSTNSVVFSPLVSRNLPACSCMRAKKYYVTEIFLCIIFHNYVLWRAHFRRFYACLFVWWCLKRQFQQYFSYIVAVTCYFISIDFLAIKSKRGRCYLVKLHCLFWKTLLLYLRKTNNQLITNSFFLTTT